MILFAVIQSRIAFAQGTRQLSQLESNTMKSFRQNNRRWVGFILFAIAATLNAVAEEESLVRFETGKYHSEHIVRSDRFRSLENAWDISMPFPADVQKFALKAAEHLKQTRDLGGPVALVTINIHSKTPSRSRKGTADGPMGERWFIAFGFDSIATDGRYVPSQELTVVMLLDGTIAEERVIRGTPAYPIRLSKDKKQ